MQTPIAVKGGHQQNDRLAVLGVYFGPSIVVRNPLWCWVTVAILWNTGVLVLGRAFICSCFSGAFLKLPMSEYVDLANSTRLFRSAPPSPRGKGQVPSPRDSTLVSDRHHPSAVPEAAKYIHSPHHVLVVRWRVFEYSMCVS